MAIQFHCVSCGKPIEIDDAWAGRLVECPYCHETITAPAFSTEALPPTSTGERPAGAVTAAHAGEFLPPPAPPPTTLGGALPDSATPAPMPARNVVAAVALVLACVALLLGFAAFVGFGIAIQNGVGASASEAETQKFIEEAFTKPERWAINMILAMFAAGGFWLAGLVCGIIGVCRPNRGLAIGALVVSALPILLMMAAILLAT